jgi:DNA repair protein RadC
MKTKAVRIRYASCELKAVVWRFKDVEEVPAGFSRERAPIRTPDDLFSQFRFMFDGLAGEQFVVFVLNTNNVVQAVDIVSTGILNCSIVHPREVFRTAILAHSAAIIVAHNHPSGNPDPSAEDKTITKQLVESGKILGIPVHDHIVFAGDKFTSMAQEGLM